MTGPDWLGVIVAPSLVLLFVGTPALEWWLKGGRSMLGLALWIGAVFAALIGAWLLYQHVIAELSRALGVG